MACRLYLSSKTFHKPLSKWETSTARFRDKICECSIKIDCTKFVDAHYLKRNAIIFCFKLEVMR